MEFAISRKQLEKKRAQEAAAQQAQAMAAAGVPPQEMAGSDLGDGSGNAFFNSGAVPQQYAQPGMPYQPGMAPQQYAPPQPGMAPQQYAPPMPPQPGMPYQPGMAPQQYAQPMPPQQYAQPMPPQQYAQPMPPQPGMPYQPGMPPQQYAQPMAPQQYAQPMAPQQYAPPGVAPQAVDPLAGFGQVVDQSPAAAPAAQPRWRRRSAEEVLEEQRAHPAVALVRRYVGFVLFLVAAGLLIAFVPSARHAPSGMAPQVVITASAPAGMTSPPGT